MTGRRKLGQPVAVFGGLAAVLFVVAFALTPTHAPNSGSTGALIAHYATANRGQLLTGLLVLALSLALTTVFAACLYRMIRRAESEDGWLAVASLASILAGAGMFGGGIALLMTAAFRPTADPAVLRALWDAGWIAFNSSGFAFGAWIAIVAAAALSTRVLPAWTAWIGIPVALINLIGPLAVKMGTGAFSPEGSFALVVGVTFPVWLIAISLGAWRSVPAPATTG